LFLIEKVLAKLNDRLQFATHPSIGVLTSDLSLISSALQGSIEILLPGVSEDHFDSVVLPKGVSATWDASGLISITSKAAANHVVTAKRILANLCTAVYSYVFLAPFTTPPSPPEPKAEPQAVSPAASPSPAPAESNVPEDAVATETANSPTEDVNEKAPEIDIPAQAESADAVPDAEEDVVPAAEVEAAAVVPAADADVPPVTEEAASEQLAPSSDQVEAPMERAVDLVEPQASTAPDHQAAPAVDALQPLVALPYSGACDSLH
jgi:hypothetical protein